MSQHSLPGLLLLFILINGIIDDILLLYKGKWILSYCC